MSDVERIPQSIFDRLWEQTDDDNWEAFENTLAEHDQKVDGVEDWMIDKIQEVVAIVHGFNKEYPESAKELRDLLIYYDNQY